MCVSVSLRVWGVYISCNFKGYIMHFTQKGVCSKACTVSTCSVHCQCQHFLDACGHCPCCEQSMILFLYFIHSVSRWRGNQCNNPALLYATELISKQAPQPLRGLSSTDGVGQAYSVNRGRRDWIESTWVSIVTQTNEQWISQSERWMFKQDPRG